ncbi:MAG TPA: hypothetical protein VKB85_16590 [Propionibacteriaceae bacterium]|nr:hypothetical protein [Propionibacteriaceae bacterium]
MPRVRRALSGALAIAAALLLAGLLPSTAFAQNVAFTVKDGRILSSSGLARDVNAGLYWTANETGDRGVVYGLTTTGAVRGTLNYRAKPVDVEGLAVVNDTLYVGDIGDRTRTRGLITVYRFDNPRATGLTVTYRSYDFAFRDGPKDAETLLVTESGRILLVTAGKNAAIYAGPRQPSRQVLNRLTKVADAPDDITDGAFLPGGKKIALRSNRTVYILDAGSYETVVSAELSTQPKGKSLAISLDGESLLLGTQGRNAKVYAVPIPTKVTPSASPSIDAQNEEVAGMGRRGTLLALGLAAIVAVVAGVVAGVIHDR